MRRADAATFEMTRRQPFRLSLEWRAYALSRKGTENALPWRMHSRYDDGRTGLCHMCGASTTSA
jgi:hypothetical protein